MKKVLILGGANMVGYGITRSFIETTDLKNYRIRAMVEPRQYGITKATSEVFDKVSVEFYNPVPTDMETMDKICTKTIETKPDYIINCFEYRDFSRPQISLYHNTVFPHALALWAKECSVPLIHISTDHVFGGKAGDYLESRTPDPIDKYGISKQLGEPHGCMVLRAGVIGPELQAKTGFYEWIFSHKGESIQGFTDQVWNGMTSKELGKLCIKIIDKNLYAEGVNHLFSPHKTSKADIIKMISGVNNLQIKIKPTSSDNPKNRSLASDSSLCESLGVSPLLKQIREL